MAEQDALAPSNRRAFLAQVTSTAVVVAGGASLAPIASASARPLSHSAAPAFDDTWTVRVSAAKFRAVFDSAAMEDGLALNHAVFYQQGFREQLGASGGDVVPVVVMRHAGTWMALNSAMWQKYGIGERAKTKDWTTGESALRNPFITVVAGDGKSPILPESSIESLGASGAIILTCNKAMSRYAGQIAQQTGQDAEAVRAEFRANLAPRVILQPSGIYAVHRAQSVGCTFIKST